MRIPQATYHVIICACLVFFASACDSSDGSLGSMTRNLLKTYWSDGGNTPGDGGTSDTGSDEDEKNFRLPDPGSPCESDADCDDGVYCNGKETCVGNICLAGTSPCADGNDCTLSGCNETEQKCVQICIAQTRHSACCSDDACLLIPVCAGEGFTGGAYSVSVSGIKQAPAGCLVPQISLPLLLGLLKDYEMPIALPAYTSDPFDLSLPVPGLGSLDLKELRFGDANNLDLPAQAASLDVGPLWMEGLNCLVAGTLEGSFTSLDLAEFSGTLTISGISVDQGSGSGSCDGRLLKPDPATDCSVRVTVKVQAG